MTLTGIVLTLLPVPAFAGPAAASVPAYRQAAAVDPNPPAKPKALSLPADPIVPPAEVGYLPSNWEVTSTGQLSYAIPLDVPAGRAGMAPQLSLAYSSGAGNGPTGVGWSVAGASSWIVRCGKTMLSDGAVSAVKFDTGDRFCLDGRELIGVGPAEIGSSGQYGALGTGYRTETDSFAEIVSSGSSGPSGPDFFVVSTKDARTLRYTARTGTRSITGVNSALAQTRTQSAATVKVAWLLESVTDRSGNQMRYEYRDFSDATGIEFQPWKITYTWGAGNVAAQRRVEFEYASTTRPDAAVTYQAGVPYRHGALLTGISMHAPNPVSIQKVWTYDLSYVEAASHRTLLNGVRKCGPTLLCQKKKIFGYDTAPAMPTFSTVSLGAEAVSVSTSPLPAMQVLDLDGDGADDIVYRRGGVNPPEVRTGRREANGDVSPLAATSSAIGAVFPTNTSIPNSRVVDVDHDGRVEFMTQYKDGDGKWRDRVLRWDTSVREFVVPANVDAPGDPLRDGWSSLGDVNGDGLLDYLSLDSTGKIVLRRQFRTATGSVWSVPATAAFTPNLDCPNSVTDVDGDGLADLLAYTGAGCAALYALSWDGVGLSARIMEHTVVNQTGTVYRMWHATNSKTERGDFNGDGLVDALWGAHVVWNTGAGQVWDVDTVPYPRSTSTSIADLNGDGLDDIVEFRSTGIWVSLSRGNGTFDPATQIAASAGTEAGGSFTTTRLGDFDADGRTDIVRIVASQMSILRQNASYRDRLVSVTDQDVAWQRETFSYGTEWSDHMENLFANTCSYPLVCIRSGMPVVRRVVSRAHQVDPTASTPARDLRYSYEDPAREARGRYLGFGTMRVWDVVQPSETVSTFNHRKQFNGTYYPEVSLPSVVTTATPIVTPTKSGTTTETARISRTYHTYTTVRTNDMPGPDTYTVRSTSSQTNEWEEPVTVRWGGGLSTTDPAEHVSAIDEQGSTVLRATLRTTQFDEYDNVTQRITKVHESDSDFPLVLEQVDSTYDNRRLNAEHDGTDWLIGLLTQTRTTSKDFAHGVKSVTRTTDFTNDDLGRPVKVEVEKAGTNPDVRQTISYTYDGLGVLTGTTTVAGDPAAPSLPARESRIEYDPVWPGQPDEEVHPSQIWQQHAPAGQRTSTWLATHPGYGVTVSTMDANGVTTTGTYDQFGRPVSAQTDGSAPATFGYTGRADAAGGTNGVVVTSTSAGITTASYTDVPGRTVKTTRTGFDGTTGVVGETGYDVLGRVVTSTGAAPVGTTTRAYDSLGRTVTTTAPDGAVTRLRYTFNTVRSIDPSGQTNTLTYDAAGRPVSSVDQLYGPSGTWRLRVQDAATADVGFINSWTLKLGPAAQCQATNGTDVAVPDNTTVESPVTVSGCPGYAAATSTVEVHIAHTYIGDLVVSLVAPDGSVHPLSDRVGGGTDNIDATYPVDLSAEPVNTIARNITTGYQYAPFGLTDKVVDDGNNTVSMVYDVRGRQTRITEPDRGVTDTTYYGTGEVRTVTDATGTVSTFSYDDMGRTTSRVDTLGPDSRNTTWEFDTAANGVGRLAAATSPDQVRTVFRYDTGGRPAGTDTTDQAAGITFSIDRTYDAIGRPATTQYPATGAGRLAARTDYHPVTGHATTVRYSRPGETALTDLYTVTGRKPNLALESATLGDGTTLGRTYDTGTGALHGMSATKGTTKVQDLTYGYHLNGLVQARVDARGTQPRVETYGYDSLGRLTTWALALGAVHNDTAYGYDSIGNLTAVDRTFAGAGAPPDETRGYGGAGGVQPHALTSLAVNCPPGQDCAGDALAYDAKGRQTSGNGRTNVTYTPFDLPRTVTRNGKTTTVRYDAFGRRFQKATGTEVTWSVGGIYERRVSGGVTTHVHQIVGPDGAVAQIVVDAGNAVDVQYQLTDALGSVNTVVGNGGTSSFHFDPFGERVTDTGGIFTGTTGDTRAGFTGHRHDDDLGQIDMSGRVYDPAQKRFLTPDPLVGNPLNGQDYNPYGYVRNSPLNYVDPSGFLGCLSDRCRDPGSGGGGMRPAPMVSCEFVVSGPCGAFGGALGGGGHDGWEPACKLCLDAEAPLLPKSPGGNRKPEKADGDTEPAPKWDDSCPDTNPGCHDVDGTPEAVDYCASDNPNCNDNDGTPEAYDYIPNTEELAGCSTVDDPYCDGLESFESPGGGRIADKRDPAPEDIVRYKGVPMHRAAAEALDRLTADAVADGIDGHLLDPVSGYRSYGEQAKLFADAVKQYGSEAEARNWVAPPGQSAHQSGRAIDLNMGSAALSANAARQRNTEVYRWLQDHAENYGFYPYAKEPWHWEYNPPPRNP